MYSFDRNDCFWLALSLAVFDDVGVYGHTLDAVFCGMHTLTWNAMHDISFLQPWRRASPRFTRCKTISINWSVGRRSQLRRITANDFEPLPLLPNDVPWGWWLQIAYSDWIVDRTLHPLAHAVGFSGPVWHPASRGEQSRLNLSLLLTQEFIHVSAAVPPSMYGDPAVRFCFQSMPPPQLLHFPSNASKLLSALPFAGASIKEKQDKRTLPSSSCCLLC